MNEKTTEFCTRILVIYGALLIGQLLFFGVTIFFNAGREVTADPSQDVFLYFSIGLLLIAMTFGIQLSRNRLVAIRSIEDTDLRMQRYQSMLIVQFMLLEAANLFSIVAYLQTGLRMIAVVAGVGLAVFVALIPLKNRVLNALGIHGDS